MHLGLEVRVAKVRALAAEGFDGLGFQCRA